MRLPAYLATAIALVLCLAVAPPVPSQDARKSGAVQPQSLLGEWWGEMTGGEYAWKVYLTLKTVQDGSKLLGAVYVVVPSTGSTTAYGNRGNRDNPVTAALEGDRLSFAVVNGPEFQVTVSDKTMVGTFRGIRISGAVTLTKRK
ncbi:MAG TPA: hypothetical protein VN646_22165 [Candidatus Acidoferrum sp.]|nr:hypothetical protein [Candidatus Acidoferrum sp.]